MSINRVQFQKGLSLGEFMRRYLRNGRAVRGGADAVALAAGLCVSGVSRCPA